MSDEPRNGVSASFYARVLKALDREFGPREMRPDDYNRLIPLVAAVENYYRALPEAKP